MNRKQTIRLNEAQLKRVIAESVKRFLNEGKTTNNIPWVGSQRYNDGYDAFLNIKKDWEEFSNRVQDMIKQGKSDKDISDYVVQRSGEIINSHEQNIANDWKHSNGVHSGRKNKHYRDENQSEKYDEGLRKYQTEWIRELGSEWNTLSFEEKKDELAKAKDVYYEIMTSKYMERPEDNPDYWYSSDEY